MRTDQPVLHLPTPSRRLVILPLGSCEQHGPYLPIDTDLRIAQLLAEKLTNTFPDSEALLLPAIPFSCSWEHKGLGTIALNVSTLAAVLHDIAHSLKNWTTPVLLMIINWHGGNSLLGSLATEITAQEEIPTAVINAISEAGRIWNRSRITSIDDIHAGAMETSIIQAYWPETVKDHIPTTAHCVPDVAPATVQSVLQALGSYTITPNGIWGAPEQANVDKGKELIDTLTISIREQILRLRELVNRHQR